MSGTDKNPKTDSQQEVVYLIVAETVDGYNYTKIGRSKNPEKRLEEIQPYCPIPCRIEHTIQSDDPSAVEAVLHRDSAGVRMEGEWFDLTDHKLNQLKKKDRYDGELARSILDGDQP